MGDFQNVVRNKLFGRNPRVVFTLNYHLDREQPEYLSSEVLTLAKIVEGVTDKGEYIPMDEFSAAMEALQEKQGIVYDEDDMLALAKACAVNEIVAYHDSSAVSVFEKDGVSYWLDHTTRSKLKDRVEAKEAAGETTTKVQLGDDMVEMSLEDCKAMLQALENYAADCFDACAAHKAAVVELESVEDIVGYDYKTGWPEKLEL